MQSSKSCVGAPPTNFAGPSPCRLALLLLLLAMSRMGADNDGSDHNYRQRIDNVYQIRADKKAELKSKLPLLLVSP